jgi:CheY-like chemotaxis protein/HPt (histidine-containing phosphotransfer) domain-containing protein
LLVDDNAVNQKVAVRMIRSLGHEADIARNGVEAVEASGKACYDVALMDVQMPVMDGLEATRQIRAREQREKQSGARARHLYVVAMTANAMAEDRDECLNAGMDDYVPKPVRRGDLEEALKRYLSRVQEFEPPAQVEATPVVEAPLQQEPAPAAPAAPDAPDAPPVESEPPVDMERLLEFAGGDAAGLRDLAQLYLQQTAEQIERIKSAIESGSADSVRRLAHTCVGSSATCGMNTIVTPLRELERLGQQQQLAGADALLRQIQREYQRIKDRLKPHIGAA